MELSLKLMYRSSAASPFRVCISHCNEQPPLKRVSTLPGELLFFFPTNSGKGKPWVRLLGLPTLQRRSLHVQVQRQRLLRLLLAPLVSVWLRTVRSQEIPTSYLHISSFSCLVTWLDSLLLTTAIVLEKLMADAWPWALKTQTIQAGKVASVLGTLGEWKQLPVLTPQNQATLAP